MFDHVKPGDAVTRVLGDVRMRHDSVTMSLTVTAIDEQFIYCGDWKFSRATGGEVDEELGWTERETGSFIRDGR